MDKTLNDLIGLKMPLELREKFWGLTAEYRFVFVRTDEEIGFIPKPKLTSGFVHTVPERISMLLDRDDVLIGWVVG